MKIRFAIFVSLTLALAACNQQPSATTSSTSNAADSNLVADTNATMATASEAEPQRPAPKSEAEQAKVRQQWADAVAAEKKFLGSPKLLGWIDGLKSTTDEDGFDQPGKLTDAQYKGLSLQEKLCYYLFHPEVSSQNCSMAFFDAGLIQGISGSLPFGSEEFPSERQMQSMESQKADVANWIVKSITTNKAASVELMQAVVAFDVKQAIGLLTDLYNSQSTKDDLILSTFIELMRKAEYAPWMNSDIAKEMQAPMGGDEYGGEMRDYAPLNQANVDKVLALAKEFAGA